MGASKTAISTMKKAAKSPSAAMLNLKRFLVMVGKDSKIDAAAQESGEAVNGARRGPFLRQMQR